MILVSVELIEVCDNDVEKNEKSEERERMIRVSVEDTGIGIGEEERKALFQLF